MKHPHYKIIKALIEDTSLDVEGRWASGDHCWEKFSRGSVMNDFEGTFEFRTKPAKKEVVSSLTIEEIEGLHNSIMGSRAHYRAIANSAAAREREECVEWLYNNLWDDAAKALENK